MKKIWRWLFCKHVSEPYMVDSKGRMYLHTYCHECGRLLPGWRPL